MRDHFKAYYQLTGKELESLWKEALIFDADWWVLAHGQLAANEKGMHSC